MTDKLDVIVFGATGFTGGLVVDYLAASAPKTLRWGIAGRRKEKLDEIAEHVRAKSGRTIETFVASIDDAGSLAEMTRCTKVLLTTVGPYARYGEPVVAACIANATDYVDITGEPTFVDGLLLRHDSAARDKGVRIVNCCGFDSIPHDLGALFAVEQLGKDSPITLEGIVQARGAVSGGTWHSAVNGLANFSEMKKAAAAVRGPDDPRVGSVKPRVRYEKAVGGWLVPLPTIDPQIVMRSAKALDVYGPKFRYGHYARVKSLATVCGLGIGIGGVFALAQLKPTRDLLLKWKDPGDGPDAAERERNFFKVTFLGKSEGRSVTTRVTGRDPGYGETAKMISESALCLAFDKDKLEDRAGVLTPATAMGNVLISRLQNVGIGFEVVSQ